MSNSTFNKVGEMLKGNIYTYREISDDENDFYRINAWENNISIMIRCNKDDEGVAIIGNVLNDMVCNETYIYDDSNCWKYNVIDFKVICTRVFCIAAKEYVIYETLASLSIYDTPKINRITTKN